MLYIFNISRPSGAPQMSKRCMFNHQIYNLAEITDVLCYLLRQKISDLDLIINYFQSDIKCRNFVMYVCTYN